MLAAKGKDCCLSGFDGQWGYLSFRNDLTSVRWQSWGPRLYEDCNVASMWQSNLVSFWRKKEKWSEKDDLGLLTCCRPLSWSRRMTSLTPLFLPPGLRSGMIHNESIILTCGQEPSHWGLGIDTHLLFGWLIFLKIKNTTPHPRCLEQYVFRYPSVQY